MGGSSYRTVWLVLAMLSAAFAPSALGADQGEPEEASSQDGCEWEIVEGIGPVCPVGELLKVRHADGSTGFVHGPDPVPSSASEGGDLAASVIPVSPVCVSDLANDAHHVFIYAVAYDDADRYSSLASDLRSMVHDINGLLRAEAAEFDRIIDYTFRCDGNGEVSILHEVLPTRRSKASFSTIVGDLRDRGYNDANAKYWIWYDDREACGCAGLGHIYRDDRLTAANYNNGQAPMYGVNFGYLGVEVSMHENGHNMGAVQYDAPESSGGYHCNDGQDIMCYADGGSTSNYDPNVCTDRTHFDCGYDTYFNPDPAPGSWLETHWNLGNELNNFLHFSGPNQAPTVDLIDCTPTQPENGETTRCTFLANDDSAGLHYEIAWGEGQTTRIPSSGKMAPGVSVTAEHIWTEPGTTTLEVRATDDSDTERTGSDTLDLTVLEVPCEFDRSGFIALGALGIRNSMTTASEPIPHTCRKDRFTLSSGSLANDLDICFYAGSTQLSCERGLIIPEDGFIPLETTRAEIILYAGAGATYELEGMEA